MNIYLSHKSAMECWLSASQPQPFLLANHATCQSSLAASSDSEEKELTDIFSRLQCAGLEFLSKPVHVAVSSAKNRCKGKDIFEHALPSTFKKEAFCRIAETVYVSSPELCFVQVATVLAFPELVLWGSELCGTYSCPPDGGGGLQKRAPLTSLRALHCFVDSAETMWGVRLARRALRYVVEGAASPMETKLTMLLCMPTVLGGYGLTFPQMNYRIDVGTRYRRASVKDYYVCDLYWPAARLAVEYDSDAFHTASEHIAQNSSRRNALHHRGITVVTVTKRQIYDFLEFERVVEVIAKALGKRLRKREQDWTAARFVLRGHLLG